MGASEIAKSYYLATLGCPKNEVDSEAIEADLQAAGLEPALEPTSADLLIVNSCGFITDAKTETIHTVLELHQMRKKNAIMVMCGCLPARYNLSRSLDEVDIFLPWYKHRELLAKLQEIGWTKTDERAIGNRIQPSNPYGYLKISEGCDNHCAYCAIPEIKGPFSSRDMGEILDEAGFLCEHGVKELILIGQDTTLYGRHSNDNGTLPQLLDRLSAIPGCEWIRLMYAHPAHLEDSLIEAFAEHPKMVKYIDLPLQHISDRILKLMNRKTTRREIESLIEKLRAKIPGLALRTTFIVGFPGETDTDFGELLDFCEAVEFENVGVFKYSPEEGTPAYYYPGRLREKAVEERYLTLLDLQNIISQRKLTFRLNQQERVLLHKVEADGTGYARAWFQAPEVDGLVIIDNCSVAPGEFADVSFTRADAYDLYATQVKVR